MARSINPIYSDDLKNLKIYRLAPNAFSPSMKEFVVLCPKHKEPVKFQPELFEGFLPDLYEEARTAVKNCKACIAEVVLPPTRWPEGAEL